MSVCYLLDNIGIYAPIIFFVISVYLLSTKSTYLLFYIIGVCLNNFLNILLKFIIKQPRPKQDNKSLEILIHKDPATDKQVRQYWDIYGMPSGHAQNFGYSLLYIFLVFKDPIITILYLVIGGISLWQRYIYKNHTILQLLVGFLIGCIFGYLVYLDCTNKIKGQLEKKPDDNAPI